jgi:hypothetical protein
MASQKSYIENQLSAFPFLDALHEGGEHLIESRGIRSQREQPRRRVCGWQHRPRSVTGPQDRSVDPHSG